MEVEATAPGKVFLLGEYAVALGGPAIVATVNRRLGCRAKRSAGTGRLTIRAGAETYRGRLHDENVADVPTGCRFVAAAARVSVRHLQMRDVDLDYETWSDLDRDGPKVGLGGSAACVAAVTAATHALAGEDETAALERAALGVAAHRLAQGGGSGADVVASTLGGIQWITGLDASDVPKTVGQCTVSAAIRAEALVLPSELALDVVGTGESASTGPRIRRFVERATSEAPAGASSRRILRSWSAGMGTAVDEFRDACEAASPSRALDAVRLARTLLGRLGAVAGIRIWTGPLRRACETLGAETALAIKPSGAGGGDCAVAIGAAGLREPLRQAWREAGLQPLEAEVSPDGARVRVVREGRGDGEA